MILARLVLAVLLVVAGPSAMGTARSDEAAAAALDRVELAAADGAWPVVATALADLSALGALDDWRDADRRLLAVAGAAEAAGESAALIAVMAKLADIRQLALPASDALVARTRAFVGDLMVSDGRFAEAQVVLGQADLAFDAAVPRQPAEQAAALMRLADAYQAGAMRGEAAAALVRAEGLFASTGDGRRSEAAWRAGEALRVLGRAEDAAILVERAVAALGAAGEPGGEGTARLYFELGQDRAALGDLDRSRDAYLAALAAVEPLGETGLRLRMVAGLADLHAMLGDRARGIAVLSEALESAGDETADALVGVNRLAGLLLEDGRGREALAIYERILDGIERLGLDDVALIEARASVLTNMARVLIDLGRPAEAAEVAGRAYAVSLILGTAGDDLVATVLAYGEALAASGDTDGAEARFVEAMGLAPLVERESHPSALLVARDAGRFYLRRRGDGVSAAAILRPAVATFADPVGGDERRPDRGRETRGEVARLLVAALWRIGRK